MRMIHLLRIISTFRFEYLKTLTLVRFKQPQICLMLVFKITYIIINNAYSEWRQSNSIEQVDCKVEQQFLMDRNVNNKKKNLLICLFE